MRLLPEMPSSSSSGQTKEEGKQSHQEPQVMMQQGSLPSDLHLLSSPDHACFFVRDHFLGVQAAQEIALETQGLQREGRLKPAGMNRGEDQWRNEGYRGDEMVWLSVGKEGNTGPATRLLLSRIEKYCKMMDTLDQKRDKSQLRLECNHKSAQLAYYPGNGKGYVRHCDSFPEEPGTSFRTLTFIYYLNADWDESQGGQLRLHLSKKKDDTGK